jgi:hypothetical protein
MKKVKFAILLVAFLFAGKIVCYAQTKVNVVKSIPLNIDKINSPVAVVNTNPITVDKVNNPIRTIQDAESYKIEYHVVLFKFDTTMGPALDGQIQVVLNKAANDGWKLITCNPQNGQLSDEILFVFYKEHVK